MNKNCSVVRDLIAMYADRETSPRTSEAIKKHLEECPDCRAYYEHTSHVVRSMKQPPRPEMSTAERMRLSSMGRMRSP